MKLVVVLATTLAIAGCATDSEMCQSYGWAPGTVGHAMCVQQADQQRRAVLLGALANSAIQRPVTCTAVGSSMSCY